MAWVLYWVFLCITFSSNAQDISNTGNLVNNSTANNDVTTRWQNIGSWNQGLPCWRGGDPGCTSSVYFNNGSFNFSYGTTNVSQAVNIATALANSGTGLQVNGFNFGFTAKNGNGWDDGRQDYLVAYANFKNAAGTIVQSYDYSAQTNRQYNWTTFNFSETFATPYAVKDLSTATYGFIGRDNNFWQGPYGPEIHSVNFSLKYSIGTDPCTTNVYSSPSCPGYTTAISSLSPSSTSGTTATVSLSPTSSSGSVVALSTDPTVTPVTNVNVGGVELSTSGTIAVPDGVPQVVKDSKPQETSTTTTSTSTVAGKTLAMSIIRQQQARDKELATSVSQKAVQENTQAGTRANQQAMSIVENTNAQVVASAQTSVVNTAVQINLPATTSSVVNTQTERPTQILPPTRYDITSIEKDSISLSNMNMPAVDYSIASFKQEQMQVQKIEYTNNIQQPLYTPKQEQKLFEVESTVQQSNPMLTSGNPINDIINKPLEVNSGSTEQQTETVKRNVQPNELAGGVDIVSMAVLPKGFDVYTNLTIKDTSFYKPEEIYKNQNTVDNVRALRQLSSDRLHQEMVNQQYRGQ